MRDFLQWYKSVSLSLQSLCFSLIRADYTVWTVCSFLIRGQALSDPERHANRPLQLYRKTWQHQQIVPRHGTPNAHTHAHTNTHYESLYLNWRKGLWRMWQVKKISAAFWWRSVRVLRELREMRLQSGKTWRLAWVCIDNIRRRMNDRIRKIKDF